MTAKRFKNDFVDRIQAEGYAKGLAKAMARGEARMLLRLLAARGIQVPDQIREQVTTCTDTTQLEAWANKAATATTLQEVFGP
jgi:hypothetical protein